MEALSVEKTPMLKNDVKWIPRLSKALIVFSVIVFSGNMYWEVSDDRTQNYGASFIVFLCLFVCLPFIHRLAFWEHFDDIELSIDGSALLLLLILLTIMVEEAIGCQGAIGCAVFGIALFIYVFINCLVMGSTCNHYYGTLHRLTLVETDALLGFDDRRVSLHRGFVENIDELLVAKAGFEKLIAYEIVIAFVFAVFLYHTLENGVNNVQEVAFNAVCIFSVTYRNFLHGCLWNSLLVNVEKINALTLERIKIKCFGMTVTYELVGTIFLSILTFLIRDMVTN